MTAPDPRPAAPPEMNRRWPWRGESLDALLAMHPEDVPLAPPAPDEVVARVEAVSICSSDIKIVRMGSTHPLVQEAGGAFDTVLGHEVCLRVHAVGWAQAARFAPSQRLILQPAMVDAAGRRSIIGMHVPGGFARFLRLGPVALASHVAPAPESRSAAEIALLEPYGCVERAWQPNVRCAFLPGGRALIVAAPHAGFHLPMLPAWRSIAVLGERPGFLPAGTAVRPLADEAALDGPYDDILALGDVPATLLARLAAALTPGGLLLQGRKDGSPGPVPIDPSRIHYDRLSFLGTTSDDLMDAFRPERCRFDVRPGGVALIHGAGGAMGRIHVHRLLQHPEGPRAIIATSRKGARLDAIRHDFGPLAERVGRRLIVTPSDELSATLAAEAPYGLDDAVVVAPSADAVAQVKDLLAPGGLLALFAGFPYGTRLGFDLGRVALDGMRLTGSTGCTLADMQGVLAKAMADTLDLSANVAAIGGLDQLPKALAEVAEGRVAGKVILYPGRPDLPLQRVTSWGARQERELIGGGA